MVNKIFLLAMGSIFGTAVAVASPFDFPGMIPVSNDSQVAVDLTDAQGRWLAPDQLNMMAKKGVDLSTLNPTNSDIWKNQKISKINYANYSLQLKERTEFKMVSNTPSVVGEYRFIVSLETQGQMLQYQVLIGKKAHNLLLRKALLEKLGYSVQNVQWLPQIRVRLNGHASLQGFLADIRNNTEGSADRWVVNPTQDESVDYVDLQDVIVLPANALFYTLESGSIPSSIIQGRRVFNSLLVPFSLVDVPESVNSLSWTAGRIINQSVYLPYEWSQQFNPGYQDALWISKKISQLTEDDWNEVVKAASLPSEVQLLLLEKLKARRNSLMQLMSLKVSDLSVNSHISKGDKLVDGKITMQKWPGYASRWSFGDPDNPLSRPEISAFLKSKGMSSIIDSAVGYMNSFLNNNQHVQNVVSDHVLQNVVDQIFVGVTSGEKKSIPLGMYKVPSISGNLLLSREVVIGSYMGTDNRVQVADTFGYQISPGYFVGIQGLNFKISESAHVGLQIQRSYTHIKPLKSIQAVSKMPYNNMIVPLLKKKWSQDLANVVSPEGKIDLNAMASALDQDLGVGESIIISDSIGTAEDLSLAYPTSPSVTFQTRFNASQLVIHRVQIYKVDKYTFQIYNDPSKVSQASVNMEFSTQGVPLLTFGLNALKGTVKTQMYTLSIGSDQADDIERNRAQYEGHMRSLKQIMFDNSLELTADQQKPFLIGHEFSERDLSLGFLFYQYHSAKVSDRFLFESPTGSQKAVLYRSTGERNGKDYATLITQILTSYLQKKTGNQSIVVDSVASGNPGDSIYGSAVTRQVAYQGAQKTTSDSQAGLSDSAEDEFAQILHTHKGWKISQKDAEQILKDMNHYYGYALNDPLMIADSRDLMLYSISLSINVYKNGIARLAMAPLNVIEKWMAVAFLQGCSISGNDNECAKQKQDYRSHIYYFTKAQREYREARSQNGPKAADLALEILNMAETYFPGKQFVQIVGEENVFVQAKIDGFRTHDEQGDNRVMSSTIGLAGARAVNGPLNYIQQNIKALSGEFFISWLLNPL